MVRPQLVVIGLLASWLGAACSYDLAPLAKALKNGSTAPGASGGIASPTSGTDRADGALRQTTTGRVLDLAGLPASGVVVRGYLVSNNSGSLVSNNSGSLVSNNSGSLVSNNSGSYRIAAAVLETRTDERGYFTLELPAEQRYNLEAVLSDDLQAIALEVVHGAAPVELHLAYTGTISGTIAAPGAPQITDLTGVDVYIPGTSFVARTDATGHYQLAHVPVGTFELVARRADLGTAQLGAVTVTSKTLTAAPPLELSAVTPVIASIEPPDAGPGASLLLIGDHFGASSSDSFVVSIGGIDVVDAKRLSDHQIQATVPSSATTGEVVASVSGLRSSVATFSVLASLNLLPSLSALPMGRSAALTVVAFDSLGQQVASPSVSWTFQGAAIAHSGGQTLSAQGIGTASVKVTSGSLASTLELAVTNGSALSTLAGTGTLGHQDGPATQACFDLPDGLAVGPDGTVYVAEWNGQRIRKISPEGMVTTLAGSGTGATLDGTGTAAAFDHPRGLALDRLGNLWVTEWETGQLRKVSPDGVVTTVPLNVGHLWSPYGIAVDQAGNCFVSETAFNRIVRIDPTGDTRLYYGGTVGDADGNGLAAQFREPHGLAWDNVGNLLVAEKAGHRIRRISPSGSVTTLAGSSQAGLVDANGTSARFDAPHDLVVDAAGVIWVSDTSNQVIRRIATNGQVTTVAGRASVGFADGAALSGALRNPRGIGLLPGGDLVLADSDNHRVRTLLK